MWTYDLAREQSPSIDNLRQICSLTLESGFNALGLYLEHRFAYPSAPWAHGTGALTPECVQTLIQEFPTLQIIPFVNLLGHFEGMLYTEEGSRFAEERFQGMQACPSKPEFVSFAKSLLDDVLSIFDSEIIHIGGDETAQLGRCPVCAAKVQEWESEGLDGKARLYGEHFGPLAQHVLGNGRRPAVWGDMLADHPDAMKHLPKETLVFDWQYFGSCLPTCERLKAEGFDVVPCPTLHTYNAAWMHLLQSEQNVRQLAHEATELDAYGVCVTTWELALFGSYDTLFPALRGCGEILMAPPIPTKTSAEGLLAPQFTERDSLFLKHYSAESADYREWADHMGVVLERCGGPFAASRTRSSLKARFLLYSNPFLVWLHERDALCGEIGTRALQIAEHSMRIAPNEGCKGVTQFVRSVVEFVRIVEQAHQEYASGKTEGAIAKLASTRHIFDDLSKYAKWTHQRIGGSLADIERCKAAKEHVERVIVRLRQYGDGQLGYRPSFEYLTHPKFMPHDQAAWWLINKWANE